MLIDEVEITLKGGHGGAGRASFFAGRFSGPDGGNGGRGGDLYARVTSDLTALNFFSRVKVLAAEDGEMGGRNKKSGKGGKDLEIVLPVGTTLFDQDNGREIVLDKLEGRVLLCKGGLGGRGNFELKSPRRTTPRFAQKGLPGEARRFKIVLKLIADFGLIGLPNSGKSSLLNELSGARATVGDYPFTTLEPNLGMVKGKILADIPGLIEGASEGKGLGIKFLKHIEKVSALIYCISSQDEDPVNDYKTVREELKRFNSTLLKKGEIVVLTKSDLSTDAELTKKIAQFKRAHKRVVVVSIHDFDSLEEFKKLLKIN